MKVSTKVEYGLVAIIDVAIHSQDDRSVNSVQIAERHGISKKFLEQIMNSLRTARLVVALKGAKGGYKLMRPAKDITLTEILNALDVSILSENSNVFTYDSEYRELIDSMVWSRMNESIVNISNGITLANLVDGYYQSKSDSSFMYYI
jgi:Rrf2 family protein